MSVVLFDTHAFVKRMTAAGMPEAQAEVLADHQARLVDERFATKADVANAKFEMLKLLVYAAMSLQTLLIVGAVVALSHSWR